MKTLSRLSFWNALEFMVYNTSTDEADGTKETCFCIIHFQRQELVGKCEHEISQRAKSGIVHLSSV